LVLAVVELLFEGDPSPSFPCFHLLYLFNSDISIHNCVLLLCCLEVKSGVMETLLTCVGCSAFHRLHWLRRIFSSLDDSRLNKSWYVGFLPNSNFICNGSWNTSIFVKWILMLLKSSFFQSCSSARLDSGLSCMIKFSFLFSFYFSSSIIRICCHVTQ